MIPLSKPEVGLRQTGYHGQGTCVFVGGFVNDFRKTRSGKPTKRLLAQVRDWDPNLDLQNATKEQKIRWRRGYTIGFLYDLVNVFYSHLPHDIL